MATSFVNILNGFGEDFFMPTFINRLLNDGAYRYNHSFVHCGEIYFVFNDDYVGMWGAINKYINKNGEKCVIMLDLNQSLEEVRENCNYAFNELDALFTFTDYKTSRLPFELLNSLNQHKVIAKSFKVSEYEFVKMDLLYTAKKPITSKKMIIKTNIFCENSLPFESEFHFNHWFYESYNIEKDEVIIENLPNSIEEILMTDWCSLRGLLNYNQLALLINLDSDELYPSRVTTLFNSLTNIDFFTAIPYDFTAKIVDVGNFNCFEGEVIISFIINNDLLHLLGKEMQDIIYNKYILPRLIHLNCFDGDDLPEELKEYYRVFGIKLHSIHNTKEVKQLLLGNEEQL